MKKKIILTLKQRIHFSFLLVVSLFILNGIITILILNKNNKLSNYLFNVLDPYIIELNTFKNMLVESKMYTTNWVFLRSKEEDKNELKRQHSIYYPELRSQLVRYAAMVNNSSITDSLQTAFTGFESLMEKEKHIMSSLQKFSDYDDPVIKLEAERKIEDEILPGTEILINSLDHMIEAAEKVDEMEVRNLVQYSLFLRIAIIVFGLLTLSLGFFLSLYLMKVITDPVRKIRNIVNDLGNGIQTRIDHIESRDEIGDMMHAVNHLSEKLSAATAFAYEIGKGNFDTYYEPLSEQDLLGKALVTMKVNLKESEKNLKEANSQMTTLFNNIEEVYFSVDIAQDKFLQISPACEKVYGYSATDFYALPDLWYKVIPDEDKGIINKSYPSVMRGKPVKNVHRIICKDGSVRWLEAKMFPTLDDRGNLIRIDGVDTDITERKEAEDALQKSNEELQKSNMELDKFVYSVSHDLRAPLASMLGVITLAEMDAENMELIEQLALLKNSVKKLDGFIQDVLDYSRNARLEARHDEINFSELFNDCLNNLKYMGADNRKVDIKLNVRGNTVFYSDKSRLTVVLNNIISNAMRYQDPENPDPFIEISVNISAESAALSVKDNGIGISEDNHGKIFNMFYRVSRNSVGSGLGLYIVKETVNKLKGDIRVQSEPGKGAEFLIQIPNGNNHNA